MQGPIIDKLTEKYASKANVRIGKLNVDDNPETAMNYGVMSIPTLLYIKDGKVIDSIAGLRAESEIDAKLNSLIQ